MFASYFTMMMIASVLLTTRLSRINVMPRLTQPTTLHGMVKWVSALWLS